MKDIDLPPIIERAGEQASRLFTEFFTTHIRSPHTRLVYARVVGQFFNWCEEHDLELLELRPEVMAAYFEKLTQNLAPTTVKSYISAIRMFMAYFVLGQVLPSNPVVRAPRADGDSGGGSAA